MPGMKSAEVREPTKHTPGAPHLVTTPSLALLGSQKDSTLLQSYSFLFSFSRLGLSALLSLRCLSGVCLCCLSYFCIFSFYKTNLSWKSHCCLMGILFFFPCVLQTQLHHPPIEAKASSWSHSGTPVFAVPTPASH